MGLAEGITEVVTMVMVLGEVDTHMLEALV
jgi:hypothetical protein